MILATRFTFIVERSLKNIYFHSKIAWPPATSYLVTIKTDHHWTWLKMCPRDKRTDPENVRPGADVLLSRGPSGGIKKREEFILITLTSSKKLICFKRKHQESLKIAEHRSSPSIDTSKPSYREPYRSFKYQHRC